MGRRILNKTNKHIYLKCLSLIELRLPYWKAFEYTKGKSQKTNKKTNKKEKKKEKEEL